MSKGMREGQEPASGLAIVEKLIGLLTILIGAVITWTTYQNFSKIGPNPNIFNIIGIMTIGLGFFLLIAKTP
jgi:hypothetical protein